jgi:hypothetical protein
MLYMKVDVVPHIHQIFLRNQRQARLILNFVEERKQIHHDEHSRFAGLGLLPTLFMPLAAIGWGTRDMSQPLIGRSFVILYCGITKQSITT